MKCKKCRYHYYLRNESWCDYIADYVREDSSCEYGEFPEDYSEPQTNYDRIISKTPEELAKELAELSERCPDGINCDDVEVGRTCEVCWLDWLNKEVKE